MFKLYIEKHTARLIIELRLQLRLLGFVNIIEIQKYEFMCNY